MNTILITKDILNDTIPFEIKPKRLDSATSLLVSVKYNEIEGLLVLNTSPDVWKTWLPFYDSINKYVINYDFKSITYKDLIEEYEVIFSKNANTKEARIESVKQQFKELYNVDDLNIIEDNIITPIYQLRYSKTAKVWTLYKLEFFVVSNISNKESILSQNKIGQEILPYNHNVTSLFNDMPITESLIYILKDKDIVNCLRKYSIDL